MFGNSAPITIACLFIISAALSRTGCVDQLGEWLAAAAGAGERRLLLALIAACLLVSPFINNTPVVMVMIPAVIAVAARQGLAPSRLLIPLSYATILGGLITMVGTSTNILVDGVARAQGLAPFSMFEISLPAILMALVGSAFMLVFAPRLLPVRETLSQQFGAGERWFMTELFVPEGSHLAGQTLREARLSNGIIQVLEPGARRHRARRPRARHPARGRRPRGRAQPQRRHDRAAQQRRRRPAGAGGHRRPTTSRPCAGATW